MIDDAISQLRERRDRHPPQRYPVQHATAQFHLGQALLQSGRPDDAAEALRASLRWFPEPLDTERAKVLNLLGAALRDLRDHAGAAECFLQAEKMFALRRLTSERGAAVFNLGLVRRDAGDPHGAAQAFARAREYFADGPLPSQAVAALHLGTAQLEAGDPDAAHAALTQALQTAKVIGDRGIIGAAANALGLAQLACGQADDAAVSFSLAVAAHPRSVRPDEFAMAKANLALAHQAGERPAHALIAARQALAVPQPPPAVRAQAQAVLEQLGAGVGCDLLAVLDDERPEQWANVVREELVRWAAAPRDERRREAAAWIEGQVGRADRAERLAEAWLSGLVELPPHDLDVVVVAVLEAMGDVDSAVAEGFRSRTARAMALFPVPQLLRLRDRFNALAAGLGQSTTWN